jgi:RHS repeat-associated protein
LHSFGCLQYERNVESAKASLVAYNLRLPGQYYDVETGKHYNYFRDYDPAVGRYVEGDPLGAVPLLTPRGRLNDLYAYVGSAPLGRRDQFGLCPCPGGTWDQDAGDWQASGSFGGYGSMGRVNFTCRTTGTKCTGKQVCIGGGLTFGAGVTFNVSGTAHGANDSNDLSGWGPPQGGGGAGAFGGQGGYDGSGGSLGVGPGFGGGIILYMRCNTFELKCDCPCQGAK